jgi:Ca-activated chloride channel family protein
MSFASPNALFALALVPLTVVALLLAQRRRVRYAVRYPALDVLARVAGEAPRWRRYLPAAMFLLALATLLLGTAKPTARVPVPRDEATVMLVLDVSGSMDAEDVDPNRLDAARAAANRFVDKLPERFQVGLVTFSSSAHVESRPTRDREALRQALASFRMRPGTAMGDGLRLALALSRTVQPGSSAEPGNPDARPPTTVLLLGDGLNTSGIPPLLAAEEARQEEVQVFTVALGTADAVMQQSDGSYVSVAPDEATLRGVAERTGGRFFTAPSSGDLASVYRELGSRVTYAREEREVTATFLAGAVALLLAGAGLSLILFRRLP